METARGKKYFTWFIMIIIVKCNVHGRKVRVDWFYIKSIILLKEKQRNKEDYIGFNKYFKIETNVFSFSVIPFDG